MAAPPSWLYPVVQSTSFFAPLAATFLLARGSEKRSFLFLAALAVCCFVLFSWLALPGFFIGLGAAALEREARREKRGKEVEQESDERKARREARRERGKKR